MSLCSTRGEPCRVYFSQLVSLRPLDVSSVSSPSWPPDDCILKSSKQMQSLPGASSRAVYSEKSTHIVLRVKWSNVPCLLYVLTWKHLHALVFSRVIEGGERSKQVPFQPFLKCFFWQVNLRVLVKGIFSVLNYLQEVPGEMWIWLGDPSNVKVPPGVLGL